MLCPEFIPDGQLSGSCDRHNIETCDVVCSPGYFSAEGSVQCIDNNWNPKTPCIPGTYFCCQPVTILRTIHQSFLAGTYDRIFFFFFFFEILKSYYVADAYSIKAPDFI